MLNNIVEYLPLLIPLVILQLILLITALVHIVRHPNVRTLNRPIWIFIIILANIIGPVLYFIFGRGEDE